MKTILQPWPPPRGCEKKQLCSLAKLLEPWSRNPQARDLHPLFQQPDSHPSPQLVWSHFSPSGQLWWNALNKGGFGQEQRPVLHTLPSTGPQHLPYEVLSHFTHWETEALRLTQDHTAGTGDSGSPGCEFVSAGSSSLIFLVPREGDASAGGSHSRSQLWETSWITSSYHCGNVLETPS